MSEPVSANEVLARLAKHDLLLQDEEKSAALREMLRSGLPVGRAAAALELPVSVAWRMVTTDKDTQKALDDGDRLNILRRKEVLVERADDMLNVIVSLAHDPDTDGSVRLKAAQDILDRTGLYQKTSGRGASEQQAAAVIELSSIDKEFSDRLHRITVRAGTRSDD
jgi:hypothetical protein